MVQLGFYYHMRQAVGAAGAAMTRPLAFALSFMLFVSVVIALFKDIPDIKGDRMARTPPPGTPRPHPWPIESCSCAGALGSACNAPSAVTHGYRLQACCSQHRAAAAIRRTAPVDSCQ